MPPHVRQGTAVAGRAVPACSARSIQAQSLRGGAFLATFAAPPEAVLPAREAQAHHERDDALAADTSRFRPRQVVSTGEVRLEPDDVRGAPMDLESRLQKTLRDDDVFLSGSTWLVMDTTRLPTECVGVIDGEVLPPGVRVFRARALRPDEGATRGGISCRASGPGGGEQGRGRDEVKHAIAMHEASPEMYLRCPSQ